MRRSILAAIAALGFVAGGCAGTNAAQDAGPAARSLGVVELTFTRDVAGARFDAQGRFARFSVAESDRDVLLGIADDQAIPLDTCRSVDGALEIERALGGSPGDVVELLDAGRLQVRGPAGLTDLSRRHYPELTPYVTGIVYGTDDANALSVEPGALYQISGEGGEEVGAFSAQVVSPRAFPTLDAEQVAEYRRGGDLDLRWAEAGEPSDPVRIVVSWSGRSGAGEVRCRVRDDGSFRIPRELLAMAPDARAEVSITRARRAPLSAVGMSQGEVSLALRDVATLPSGDAP